MTYYAEVIDLSLIDRSILQQFSICQISRRFFGLLKIYTLQISQMDIEETITLFQKNLGTKLHKEWYITFHTKDRSIVVFRDTIFRLSNEGIVPVHSQKLCLRDVPDRENWKRLFEYAKLKGIPDSQCDFLPENYRTM